MIDYTVLKVLWWIILGCVLVVYAATAGFDSGVTTIMPFLKSEDERRVALNTSAPTWDGNLTWIVFAGGGIFVVWPAVYATAFSGLYFAMLLILFPLFFRPPGYEYRSKLDSHAWRRMWDIGLLVSGIMPVFMFGVATGNCFVGFPFHLDPITLRIFYTGDLWGLLNPLGLLAGFTSVLMVIMHGGTYLQRRTEGNIARVAKRCIYWSGTLLFILFSISGVLIVFYTPGYKLVSQPLHPTLNILGNVVVLDKGGWFTSYFQYPWKFFGPIAAYCGIAGAMWATYHKWKNLAFWSSVTAVAGIVGTSGFTLFPFIMPSSTNPNESFTVFNAVSSQYGLNIMLYVGVVLFAIIIAYKLFAYHSIWGKQSILTVEDLRKNEHTFY